MEYEKIAKQFRKKKICGFDFKSSNNLNFTQKDIEKILPHRDPFLLIDSINKIDLEQKVILGKRFINPDDPLFKGHFPDFPIYPGILHIEMIGQLGLCLFHLIKLEELKRAGVTASESPINVRLLKVNHTLFQHEVLPNEEVTIIAKELYIDEYKGRLIGQIIKDDNICTVAICEAYLVD